MGKQKPTTNRLRGGQTAPLPSYSPAKSALVRITGQICLDIDSRLANPKATRPGETKIGVPQRYARGLPGSLIRAARVLLGTYFSWATTTSKIAQLVCRGH
jgi:hypothetical protein